MGFGTNEGIENDWGYVDVIVLEFTFSEKESDPPTWSKEDDDEDEEKDNLLREDGKSG